MVDWAKASRETGTARSVAMRRRCRRRMAGVYLTGEKKNEKKK
jgi:hypothetical protein